MWTLKQSNKIKQNIKTVKDLCLQDINIILLQPQDLSLNVE